MRIGVGRWRVVAAVTVVATAGLAGCAAPVATATITGPTAAGAPPDHLIVVIEENHSFEQIIGSPAAPFLNRLAARGTLLSDYHAIAHPSLPNYVALLSGSTPIEDDCRACTFSGSTLVAQLEARHLSWAAYLQGLPRPCSTVAGAGAYTDLRPVHARRPGPGQPRSL